MKAFLTPRALSEAKRIKTWWLENRPDCADLFDDEMQAAVELIRTTQVVGTLYPARLETPVRRVLLTGTQNHVYFTVDDDLVVVLSVWGAPRRRGPKL